MALSGVTPVMATSTGSNREPLVSLPSHPLGYVAVLAALVTAAVHLALGQRVMGSARCWARSSS